MRKILVAYLLMAVPVFAMAQGNEPVQRSSSPSGLKINDSSQTGGAGAVNSATSSSADPGSTASASSQQGGGKSAVQIQGNTAIKASVRNLNSVATGQNSAAGNQVGAIGK